MTLLKRLGVAMAMFSLTSGLMVSTVAAQGTAAPATGLSGALSESLGNAAPDSLKGAEDINVVIGGLISSVVGFLGVVLFVYLLYGGFLYMTAAGDAGQVKKAVDVIKSAIIGLVIIASAYAIANFVITELGTATSSTTPTQ